MRQSLITMELNLLANFVFVYFARKPQVSISFGNLKQVIQIQKYFIKPEFRKVFTDRLSSSKSIL